jgi:DNA processing protein
MEINTASALATRILSPFDTEYPKLLRQVPDRPAVLYVRGDLRALQRPSVAIIGTRQPTSAGREMARRIAEYFGTNGWNVVSGLAIGCDTAAHEGALQGQGVTTAVLASGVDQIVPVQNTDLARRILEGGGALVGEYAFGAPATAGQFVQRDRIQAALAAGVVVVQTDLEGGSLHACRAIIRYGRLLAYPLPTLTDVARNEPKITGIQKLMVAKGAQLADFLKAPSDASSQLFAIRTKDDYPALVARLRDYEPAVPPPTG